MIPPGFLPACLGSTRWRRERKNARPPQSVDTALLSCACCQGSKHAIHPPSHSIVSETPPPPLPMENTQSHRSASVSAIAPDRRPISAPAALMQCPPHPIQDPRPSQDIEWTTEEFTGSPSHDRTCISIRTHTHTDNTINASSENRDWRFDAHARTFPPPPSSIFNLLPPPLDHRFHFSSSVPLAVFHCLLPLCSLPCYLGWCLPPPPSPRGCLLYAAKRQSAGGIE